MKIADEIKIIRALFLVLIAATCVASSDSATAATSSEEAYKLPWFRAPGQDAKDLLKEGLEAAQEENWPRAIDRFQKATEWRRLWPSALFNLGWAHDKAGGHQFLAAIWYRAYLAAKPLASDAEAVNRRIEELLGETERAVSRIMSMEEEIVGAVSADDVILARSFYCSAWLRMGRTDKALDVATRQTSDAWTRQDVAVVLARQGKAEQALDHALYLHKNHKDKPLDRPLADIACALAERGDIARAKTVLNMIEGVQRAKVNIAIAKAHIERDQLDTARRSADTAHDTYARAGILSALVTAHLDRGEIDEAITVVNAIPEDRRASRAIACAHIGKWIAQNNRGGSDGYFARARKELESPLTSHTLKTASTAFFEAGSALVLAMAEAGKHKAAEELLAQYDPDVSDVSDHHYFEFRAKPWYDLARIMARLGTPDEASETLVHMIHKVRPNYVHENEYVKCLADMTYTLAEEGEASFSHAETLYWSSFGYDAGEYADLATLETSARYNSYKYVFLPKSASLLHLALERFRKDNAKWKAVHERAGSLR